VVFSLIFRLRRRAKNDKRGGQDNSDTGIKSNGMQEKLKEKKRDFILSSSLSLWTGFLWTRQIGAAG
jgi:hypothetical protein